MPEAAMEIVKTGKFAFLASCVLLTILMTITTCPAVQNGEEEPFSPRIGYSASAFVDVDMNDAQALTSKLSAFLVRKKGGTAETKIYATLNDLDRDLKSKKIDLIVLVANEFVELKNRAFLEPLFVSVRENEPYERLVLLVRKDGDVRTNSDLRNKIFVRHRGQHSAVHRIWLETLVMREGLPNAKRFFKSVKEVMKPSQAVMSVFFKKADACIVTRNTFEMMAELNPQLSRDMTALAESRPIASGVVAVRRDYNTMNREKLQDILERLHLDVQGKQLLTMFRMNRLVSFQQEYLASTEEFLWEHRKLKNQLRNEMR
jgi:ABC-type phosphate/phosphonate transport system substrate-binding protein